MRTSHGSFELEVPRDRNSTFEPQIVKKRQSSISDEIESKIISLYSYGMSYNQIRENIEEIYGIKVSEGTFKYNNR